MVFGVFTFAPPGVDVVGHERAARVYDDAESNLGTGNWTRTPRLSLLLSSTTRISN